MTKTEQLHEQHVDKNYDFLVWGNKSQSSEDINDEHYGYLVRQEEFLTNQS